MLLALHRYCSYDGADSQSFVSLCSISSNMLFGTKHFLMVAVMVATLLARGAMAASDPVSDRDGICLGLTYAC